VIITNIHYSVCNSVSIYRRNTVVGIYRLNYRRNSLTWKFLPVILPTNHRGIQTGIFVQWRDQFTVRGVDNITDRMSPSVIPSAKVNISTLCQPSPPLFLLLLPHPNSPLPSQTANKHPPKQIPLFSTQVIFL